MNTEQLKTASDSRLTALNIRFEKSGGRWKGQYICACGNLVVAYNSAVKIGNTKSCGCLRNELTIKRSTKHGFTRKERLYAIWKSIRDRCNNPNCESYKIYGGKGIKLCTEWNDYPVFRAWALSHGYNDQLTIERDNNNIGYNPTNCRWIPKSEQGKNTIRVIPKHKREAIKIDLQTLTYAEIKAKHNVSYTTITKISKDPSNITIV